MRAIKMGMTKEQFIEGMDVLDGAFPKKDYAEKKTLGVWWRYLSRFDEDVFQKVIDDWILTKTTAPTIADLRSPLNRNQLEKYHELEKADGVPSGTYIKTEEWLKR